MARLNLIDIYKQAFGYKAITFYPIDTTISVDKAPAESFATNSFTSIVKEKSILGTPYFQRTTLDGFKLPNEPIIEITGTKNIIKTQIDGNNGTFKESFSLGDYLITIKGLIIDDNNPDEYPSDLVRRIRTIYEKNKSVSITNDILTLFAIDLVCLEDIKWPAIEGAPGIQPYEITCSSDKEFDIELKKVALPMF